MVCYGLHALKPGILSEPGLGAMWKDLSSDFGGGGIECFGVSLPMFRANAILPIRPDVFCYQIANDCQHADNIFQPMLVNQCFQFIL
jgi:hypothetical protein